MVDAIVRDAHNLCMDLDRRNLDTGRPFHRSTDARDYQELPQSVAVMPKAFRAGHVIAPHHHPRDQLVFAIAGIMRVSTRDDAWIVPPDRALLMPAGVEHSVEMRGDVAMRTLYISPSEPTKIKVLAIDPLLRELISALAVEPMDYSGNLRAEQIATLIGTELTRAEALPLNTPLPQDPRLQLVCQKLIQDPAIALSLDLLADGTGASAKTLARLCEKELGMSFSAWRRRVRFSKAFELLAQNKPMKQVAKRCGYESASAFTFAFRKEYGAAPTEFRQLMSSGGAFDAG